MSYIEEPTTQTIVNYNPILQPFQGRPSNGKSRPLLIKIDDEGNSTRQLIIRRAKELRQSIHWINIFIVPDQTPNERELGKKLREELKREDQLVNKPDHTSMQDRISKREQDPRKSWRYSTPTHTDNRSG